LILILWSVNGIQSLLDVIKGITDDMAFFIDDAMPSFTEGVRPRTGRKALKSWLIHMDNARPDNLGRVQSRIEASRTERLPRPAYSPGVASSDFLLFGAIKGKLSDYGYESRDDLLNATAEISTGFNQEVLLSVFESGLNRLMR
jgi:hypothetical protein